MCYIRDIFVSLQKLYINEVTMLIRFDFSNIFSFLEETEFNMLPAKSLKSHSEHLHKINSSVGVLKGSVIYGANGAGKSNMIKAANLLRDIVLKGKVPSDVRYIRNKFSDNDAPISQSVEFSYKNKVYNYGITYTSKLCLEEWLYETGSEKEEMVFERTYSADRKKPIVNMGKKYTTNNDKNALLISLLEDNILKNDELLIKHEDIIKEARISRVKEWFRDNLKIFFPETKSASIFDTQYENLKFKQFSEKLLRSFDVGIQSVELHEDDLDKFVSQTGMSLDKIFEDIKSNLKKEESGVIETQYFTIGVTKEEDDRYIIRRITTNHVVNGMPVSFELKEESDGTQRLFDFAPVLYDLMSSDKTIIVDEIDRSIHANLLKMFVEKVMSLPIKGQIIFSSHESCLLDCSIFRNDEIWFVEKDREKQSSRFYTLNDFKPRNDLDIQKGYLKGRFGAIPFLSHLEDLKWEE